MHMASNKGLLFKLVVKNRLLSQRSLGDGAQGCSVYKKKCTI